MNLAAFAALPDEARLWLLALAQPVDPAVLALELNDLLGRWHHKGTQYQAAWALLEQRLVAIAEPTLAAAPSGCAIDGMLRGLDRAATRLGTALEDPTAVLARLPGGLCAFPRPALEARLADGTLSATTPILDLALLTLGDLRQGKLERPLAATWIGRRYKIQAPAETGA
jgi:hypothetical protein